MYLHIKILKSYSIFCFQYHLYVSNSVIPTSSLRVLDILPYFPDSKPVIAYFDSILLKTLRFHVHSLLINLLF